jgi:hypothetical protein
MERWKLQLPFEIILLPDSRWEKEQSHINLATMEEGREMEACYEG